MGTGSERQTQVPSYSMLKEIFSAKCEVRGADFGPAGILFQSFKDVVLRGIKVIGNKL